MKSTSLIAIIAITMLHAAVFADDDQDDWMIESSVVEADIADPIDEPCVYQDPCPIPYNKAILEARFSYFSPYSGLLRDIYHGGGIDYALTLTVPVWRGLNVWAAGDYFTKHGKLINFDAPTRITMWPLTLGLKYLFPVNTYFTIYGGAGMKYYFVEVTNKAPVISSKTSSNGLGGVLEIGAFFYYEHLVLDAFIANSFKKLDGPSNPPGNAVSENTQVGGWNFGGGLGYQF